MRLRPRAFYQLLLRLTTVENSCGVAGTWTWANAFERLWFDLFDPQMQLASWVGAFQHADTAMLAACASERQSAGLELRSSASDR